MDGQVLRQARDAAGFALGLIVLTAATVMVFTGMRDVMDIGGSCASGGPYVVANPCPEGTGWLMTGGIFGWFAGAGLVALFGFRLGGAYGAWAFLGWPALFLSLGWNFWEYGTDPVTGGGTDGGLVFCAVIFFLMGGLPLVFAAKKLPQLLWPPADATPARAQLAGKVYKVRPTGKGKGNGKARGKAKGKGSGSSGGGQRPQSRSGARRPTTVPGVEVRFVEATGRVVTDGDEDDLGDDSRPQDRPVPQDAPVDPETGAALPATGRKGSASGSVSGSRRRARTGSGDDGGLVADLERLAGLRASGAIDEGEYERAKDVVLGRAEEDA